MNEREDYQYAPLQQHEETSVHTDDGGNNNLYVSATNREPTSMDAMVDCADEELSFHGFKKKSRYSCRSLRCRGPNALRSLTNLEIILSFAVAILSLYFVISLSLYISSSRKHDPKCEEQTSTIPAVLSSACITRPCVQVANRIIEDLDERVDPCEDFYQFSCGGWEKKNPLPIGHSRWSTFNVLNQKNQAIMKNILEANTTSESSSEKKAKLFYKSCLDLDSINKLSTTPLIDIIAEIGGWSISGEWNQSDFDFNKSLELMAPFSLFPFFSMDVGPDSKHSNSNVVIVSEGGLSLGERAYYVNKTIDDDHMLSAYLEYMTDVGSLLSGDRNDTRRQMHEILSLEKEIAEIMVPREQLRDESKNYHRMNMSDLLELAGSVDWIRIFQKSFKELANVTIGLNEPVITSTKSYLEKFSAIVYKTPKKILNNYLVWNFASTFVGTLGQPFLDAQNKFHKVQLGSDMNCIERWHQCVGLVDKVLGEPLGRLFIEHKFDTTSKVSAEKMVTAIKSSFQENLNSISWMDAKTKEIAAEKAAAVEDMVGFPDDILNITYVDGEYEKLILSPSASYFDHYVDYVKFVTMKELQSLREPVKRNEWSLTPPTINAYYSPNKNVIVFPAGILQPPFYRDGFPQAINFGGIGIVVGHELTHGFDDQGRQYDLNGNLNDWWEENTLKEFKKKAECMIEQYNDYDVNGGKVNGNMTIGENIADNGGMRLAYNAYKKWKEMNGSSEAELVLPALNYTDEQLFFIAFAQLWCNVNTPERSKELLLNDVHSPNRFRVIGTMSNSPEFAEAFKCPAGSKMNPVKKCVVW
ncbi:unnamed protein product [Clavelina lepadiformis]|uniref:Endothelin-converting enzyme 1 n=1 Tax=Clavelina lepadiformis TaxID=159417 RepID=A0ABP0EXE0_CLALP